MALVVEDGSGIANADSYISLADARTLLNNLGQDLDLVDATAEQQLRLAKDYVDSFRDKFKGYKGTREQSLQFPRHNVYIDGWLFPSDQVPTEIKEAQAIAAYEVAQGETLQSTGSGRKVQSEKLDVLEISYFKNSATESSKIYKRVIDKLKAFMSAGLSVVRV